MRTPSAVPAEADRLALSSMYAQRFQGGADMRPFFEIGASMGFRAFELNGWVSPQALATVDPRAVRIASVHAPCPRPPDHKPGAHLISRSADDRKRAARAITVAIETAARLSASAVVVHLGRAEDDRDGEIERLSFELESRFGAGQHDQGVYRAVLERLVAVVEECEERQLEHALDALPRLLAFARDQGVMVGIETGRHALDLPSPTGLERLLSALAGDGLRAWLDTGHVGAQANLGTAQLADWFRAAGSRWLGAHLHDVVGLRDHLVPGMGHIDFADLASRFPDDALRTCEIDWYFRPDEVRRGTDHLRRAGWT